jgi:hypothetical protein
MTDVPPGPRTILHLDMDAFFASVEQLDRREDRVHVEVEDGALPGCCGHRDSLTWPAAGRTGRVGRT